MISTQHRMYLKKSAMQGFSIRSMQSLSDKLKRLFAWSTII